MGFWRTCALTRLILFLASVSVVAFAAGTESSSELRRPGRLVVHVGPLKTASTSMQSLDLVMPPTLETDLWHGLVVPGNTASTLEIEMMRKLFNENMTTVHDQTEELKEQTTLPAAFVSVVIAYCSHSLEWLPTYLHGMQINDVTIYSKCNHTDALTQSSYIDKVRSIARNRWQIKTLPNVGGCDHTYAHDMAHRDWERFAGREAKHIVLYLKDSDTQLCTKNMMEPRWTVLRPSTMIQVAAMSGFGCNIRTTHLETLWHATPETRLFAIKKYRRVGGTEIGAADPFPSPNFRNMGAFAEEMGVILPEPFMQVCYGGTFAVSGAQFINGSENFSEKVKVAQRLELGLARGNNIEEGHFIERMWAGFLQTPATPEQAASLQAMQTKLCAKIGNKEPHCDVCYLTTTKGGTHLCWKARQCLKEFERLERLENEENLIFWNRNCRKNGKRKKSPFRGKLTVGGPGVRAAQGHGWRGGSCSFNGESDSMQRSTPPRRGKKGAAPSSMVKDYANNITEKIKGVANAPKRQVVLLGPHDRYNFGDLLFEKVVSKLLVDVAGYSSDDLISAGIHSVNMSRYGGNPNIRSMKEVQELSFASPTGPFDIIFLGGEATGCSFACAVGMMPTNKERLDAKADQVDNCAYLFPKAKLIPPNYHGQQGNFAVINSLGGDTVNEGCCNAFRTADYSVFRDGILGSLAPDCAVMVKQLFNDHISNLGNFPEIVAALAGVGSYVAVQHRSHMHESYTSNSTTIEIAKALDVVGRETHSTIVFFAAGTVPGHDSFDYYKKIAGMMTVASIVFEVENVWSVVALIAHAKVVISTSLHVRIMAFIFLRPRVTWCSGGKFSQFIKLWEPPTSKCSTYKTTWSDMTQALVNDVVAEAAAVQHAVDQYLVSFRTWSNLLLYGNRTTIHSKSTAPRGCNPK